MPSATGKHHIDLIRHRELNALRRLMAERKHGMLHALTSRPAHASAVGGSTELSMASTSAPVTQTLERINAIEAQMTTTGHTLTSFMASIAPNREDATVLAAQLAAEIASEQAAIHTAADYFANDQLAQAQQCLEQAIAPSGLMSDHVPTWLALLDLYRASNQALAFDSLALDFSVRFGRSTPSWLSIPDSAKREVEAKKNPAQPSIGLTLQWSAPPHMTLADIERLMAQTLEAAQSGGKTLLITDWRDLATMEEACWPPLASVLSQLAQTRMKWQASGTPHLAHFFHGQTAPAALAKMAWLRCQNQMTAFEDCAMDYCAAFEVSPPDWQPPLCEMAQQEWLFSDEPLVTPSQHSQLLPKHQPLQLVGSVLGSIPTSFGSVSAALLSVACEHLVRCDFAATQALLKWAKALHEKGAQIEFCNVHRLIAAYFLAHGIFAYAKVITRKD
jgi:hypothetical protein